MAKSSNREANVVFKIGGTDNSRQDIKKLRDEVEAFGDEGKKAAQHLSDGFGAMQKAVDRAEKAIANGKQVSQRDLKTIVLAYGELESKIIETWGTAERAPEAAQQALALAKQQLEGVTAKVREQKDVLSEHAQELQEGGEQWTGFSNAANKALGPLGAVQAKLALVGVAFKEGWQAGMQLNQFFKVDMSEWEFMLEGFASRGKVIISGFFDVFLNAWQLQIAAMTGDMPAMKAAWNELKGSASGFYDAIVEGSDRAAEAAKKIPPEIKKVRDAHVEARASLNDLNAAYAAGKITTGEYNDALLKLFPTLDAATQKANEGIVAEARRQAVVKDTIKQIDETIAALEREREARRIGHAEIDVEIAAWERYKATLEAAHAAKLAGQQVTDGLTETMRAELLQLQGLLPEYEKHRGEVAALSAGFEKEVEIHRNGLSPERRKALDALIEQIKKYESLDPYQQQYAQRLINEALQLDAASSAAKGNKVTFDELTGSITNVTEKTDDLNISFGSVAEKAGDAAVKVGKYADEIERAVSAIDSLLLVNKKLAESMGEVDTATDKAAGGTPASANENAPASGG